MFMRCRTARRWLTRELAGELPPRRVEQLARHVERCEDCRREQVAYAALDRALGLLPTAAELPPRFEQDTLRRVRVAADDADPREPGRIGRWVLLGAPALAATAALGLALHGGAPPDTGRVPTTAKAGGNTPAKPAAVELAQGEAPTPATPQAGARPRRIVQAVPGDPPPELAARADLFVDLPMLRNLDKLQHYEAIQTTTLDGQQEDQSNG
jgi:hypothetical protein